MKPRPETGRVETNSHNAFGTLPRPDDAEFLAPLVCEEVGVDGGSEASIVNIEATIIAVLVGRCGHTAPIPAGPAMTRCDNAYLPCSETMPLS